MIERQASLSTAFVGVVITAVVFLGLRAAGVFTARNVFQPAEGSSVAPFLYWGVLFSFAGFTLLLSWRLGSRWAARRGTACLVGSMAAGVHVVSWCAVGVLVGFESATGGLSEFAWMSALLVLAVSTLVFVGVCFSFLRPAAV
ncbi:hypothetical protein [Arthrobacter flavus]|uniref:Integral membrane protein n=1 Tax=Arthrobacter flavus TaxID=95172 RepID=A0ABW4Q9B5_9MICC